MKVETPAEQLFFVTVRIEGHGRDGERVGTGFLVEHQFGSDKKAQFLVTNRHVVRGAEVVRFFFLRGDGDRPLLGERDDFEVADVDKAVFFHPDAKIDVAVLPFGPLLKQMGEQGFKPFFRIVGTELIPSQAVLDDFDALEEVVFVGYPSGIFDAKNYLPIVRRGTTATPPSIDYGGQPCFLIDAAVFPGSSGSPVFICNTGGFPSRSGFVVGTRLHLLGLISAVLVRQDEGTLEFVAVPSVPKPRIRVSQVLALGVVIKARTIVETIEACLRGAGLLK